MTAIVQVGVWARLSPALRRLTQDNPGPFTGTGTNTFLIGVDPLWILDPGPDHDDHFAQIVDEVAAARVLGILCSHSHPDHWPMVPRLAGHFSAPALGFASLGGYEPDELIQDGAVLDRGGPVLQAIHTPGHARDHLCFLWTAEGVLFSADHVMGWSTSVIAPPGGNLNAYMSSLDKLQELSFATMHPAHGPPIEDPLARIIELREHRLMRTREALAALEAGLRRIPEMVERIYVGLDERLVMPASWSLLAHLEALVEEGKVSRTAAGEPLKAEYELTSP